MKSYIIDASFENGLYTTLRELNAFIGIIILTTFNKRTTEKDYCLRSHLVECPIIRSTMHRDRFLQIKTNLKCSKAKDEDPNDPAWRVRVILEMFRKNIKCFGFFERALSIDEMIIKFFGRLKMKQFIRNKPISINAFNNCSRKSTKNCQVLF